MRLLQLAARAARVLPGRRGAVAAFLTDRATMDRGASPAQLGRTIRRLLSAADARLDAGDVDAACELAVKAQILAFHPRGMAQEHTPASDDAQLAPFRASRIGQLLHGPVPAAPPAVGKRASTAAAGEIRLLVVAHKNFTFADRLIDLLRDEPGLAIEKIDLAELGLDDALQLAPLTRDRVRIARGGARIQPPPALAEAIRRSDVVLAEWGNQTLAYMSMLDGLGTSRGGAPLLSRVHRYELDTAPWHLADVASVDSWLFIAAHIARRAQHQRGIEEDRIHLVHNANDLARFDERKSTGAERTLLHEGWSRRAKDVGFALDVLELLPEDDPPWRLLLAGRPAAPGADPETDALRARIDAAGAVEILGFRDDMPRVLEDVGFILSTSLGEGSHEVVAEGAAAACVPVVRDWPHNRGYGGAVSVYPEQWVVADAERAARRILDLQNPAVQRREGAAARRFILSSREPAQVRESYVAILRGLAADA